MRCHFVVQIGLGHVQEQTTAEVSATTQLVGREHVRSPCQRSCAALPWPMSTKAAAGVVLTKPEFKSCSGSRSLNCNSRNTNKVKGPFCVSQLQQGLSNTTTWSFTHPGSLPMQHAEAAVVTHWAGQGGVVTYLVGLRQSKATLSSTPGGCLTAAWAASEGTSSCLTLKIEQSSPLHSAGHGAVHSSKTYNEPLVLCGTTCARH
jgi:hypothetical protein